MVLVKNLNFFHLFILGLIGQENVFVNILERKKGFLDSKITKLKKSNIWYFSKGVSPWFFSLRSKHFQSSHCAKVRAGAKKSGRGRGRGEEETLTHKPHDSGKRPLIFHSTVHL